MAGIICQALAGGATHFIGLNGAPDVIHLDTTPSAAGGRD